MYHATKYFTLSVQNGFKTKTQLQQLAEGKIEFKPPKNKNTKNNKKTKEMEENGLITRKTNDGIEYELTEKGLALNKVLYELAMFTLNTDINNRYYDDENKKELKKVFKEILL